MARKLVHPVLASDLLIVRLHHRCVVVARVLERALRMLFWSLITKRLCFLLTRLSLLLRRLLALLLKLLHDRTTFDLVLD